MEDSSARTPGVWPSGLPRPIDRALRKWVREHTDFAMVRLARRAVYGALSVLHTEDHSPWTNGELRVLQCISSEARVIIDVGANQGTWARAAQEICTAATVHCFELALPVRRRLRQAVADNPKIVVAESGLADRAGHRRVKFYHQNDALTSLYDYPHPGEFEWRDEPVMRGDDYLEQHGIERVDLLKIDAEGAELIVLEGFHQSLTDDKVTVVQFEYGYCSILSGALLYRMYGLLEPLGYRIGRILPQRVEFRPYTLFDERFYGPNFLAVHRSRPDLIARLSG
ncbi:FkbM family methyltransferase [Thermomonospora amylolytica]|uniref:FkbM family methyltransferase n=1 Tax=Thermomonospora amylolytica TaxID=1411117 RepID=UPI000E6CB100|nr:FkbM family methyltransferase [Thermomonospora amylolytica]